MYGVWHKNKDQKFLHTSLAYFLENGRICSFMTRITGTLGTGFTYLNLSRKIRQQLNWSV